MGQEQTKTALDRARGGGTTNLFLALAIAAWEAERNLCLGFSYGYGVSETAG